MSEKKFEVYDLKVNQITEAVSYTHLANLSM